MRNDRKMAVSIRFFLLILALCQVPFEIEAAARRSGHKSSNKGVVTSQNSGALGGFWGVVSNFANSIFNGGEDKKPNLARLFQYELDLQHQFIEMEDKVAKMPLEAGKKPIKFPEATAFTTTFIRDIGGLLEYWMDLSESKKAHDGFRKLSQHILWSRTVHSETKILTSYFTYRPSFEAELESSTILPHLSYHAEARETFAAVLEVIEQYPYDQIIFVGLLGAGAIAMLHAWMAVSSVPILYKNLKEYKGELHQIKIILYDTDCVLSQTHASHFPIPAWDILRFYSGLSNLRPDSCKFDSMTPVGLAYANDISWYEFLASSHSPLEIERAQFVEYYLKNRKPSSKSNVIEGEDYDTENDTGIEDGFNDAESIVASEISMSVDGRRQASNATPSISPNTSMRKQTNVQVQSIEQIIKPGIELLRSSIEVAQFFFRNSKNIYFTHQNFYLQRNVMGCAAAMQKNLMDTLKGFDNECPLVPKAIKEISCSVKKYNAKKKVALIVCNIVGNDLIQSPVLQFSTHVQNEMEMIIFNKGIHVYEEEYEEGLGGKEDDGDANGNGRERTRSNSYQQLNTFYTFDDVFFDERSQLTGFQEKSAQWTECLEEIFKQNEPLNFINPFGQNYTSSKSVVAGTGQNVPGLSVLSITLPFSSTLANCEYSLLTQPKNFYQLYSVSSSMFFSIFSSFIETQPMPPVCSRILEPPSIPRYDLGNAEKLARILNSFFNSDGTARIDFGNTIVNGLEIEESTTNLPNRDPYAIFTISLCNKVAECLAKNVIDKLYNCNSPLTLWAGRHHCPDVCLSRPGLHLCSRIADCGDGVYFGFRGCMSLGSEPPLEKDFEMYSNMNQNRAPAYYAAFHMKRADGMFSQWNWNTPFRFAVFLNDQAMRTFLSVDEGRPAVSSSSSVASAMRKKSTVPVTEIPRPAQEYYEESDEFSYDEDNERLSDHEDGFDYLNQANIEANTMRSIVDQDNVGRESDYLYEDENYDGLSNEEQPLGQYTEQSEPVRTNSFGQNVPSTIDQIIPSELASRAVKQAAAASAIDDFNLNSLPSASPPSINSAPFASDPESARIVEQDSSLSKNSTGKNGKTSRSKKK